MICLTPSIKKSKLANSTQFFATDQNNDNYKFKTLGTICDSEVVDGGIDYNFEMKTIIHRKTTFFDENKPRFEMKATNMILILSEIIRFPNNKDFIVKLLKHEIEEGETVIVHAENIKNSSDRFEAFEFTTWTSRNYLQNEGNKLELRKFLLTD